MTVPAGQYLLASEIPGEAPPDHHRAGRDTTRIIAQGPRAFTFNLNAGAYTVEPTGTPDCAPLAYQPAPPSRWRRWRPGPRP